MINNNKITLLFAGLFIVALTGTVYAHPETGFLPDAIAETEYRIVIELDPGDIETRNKLGIVLYRKDKLKEALVQFREVLTLRPDDFDAHDGTGLVLMKQGRYKKAIKWLERAVELNPKDAMVYYHLGSAYKETGEIEKAIKGYEKSLSLQLSDDVLRELNELKKRRTENTAGGLTGQEERE